MKRINKLILLVTSCLTNSICLFAQVSSTVTNIGIDAIVIAPITIEKVSGTDLDFGTVSSSSTFGTVTVPPSGDRIKTGGVSLVGTSYSSVQFTVTGEKEATFNITLPADGTVKFKLGSELIDVDDFDCGSAPTILTGGTATFNVGATLKVPANQQKGTYTGTFTVTVAYQ